MKVWKTKERRGLFGAGKGVMWVGVGVSEEGAGAAYLCPPDRDPEEGQQRVIWVSRESEGLGVDSGGPSGFSLQV